MALATRRLRPMTPNCGPLVTIGGADYSRELLNSSFLPIYDTSRLAVMNNGRMVRFKTGPGDHGDESEQTTLNERTELLTVDYKTRQSNLLYQFGDDIWLSRALLIPLGDRIRSDFTIIEQMHSVQGSLGVNRQPSYVLNVQPQTDAEFAAGVLRIDIQTRFADPVAGTSTNVPSTLRWQKTIIRGQSYNLLTYMRYSLGGTGALTHWIDGVKEADLTGLNIGYNEPGAPGAAYFQFGHYRHQSSETIVTFVANMEQGKGSLLSRASNPLPVGSEPYFRGTPYVTGGQATGSILTAYTDPFIGAPLPLVSYKWFRNGADTGVTTATYTRGVADVDAQIDVDITLTNSSGVRTQRVTVIPAFKFSFADQTDAPVSTVVLSNVITLTGLSGPKTISIVGGEYRINGGAWTASAGTVSNSQSVQVRLTTSASNSALVKADVTIDTVTDSFAVTTVAASSAPVGMTIPTGSPSGMAVNYQTNFVDGFAVTDSGYKDTAKTQPAWRSQFTYDRRTPNNNELGFYSDPVKFPATNPFPVVDESGVSYRRLRADKLASPLTVEGKSYSYSAALMSAKNHFLMSDGDMVECRFSCPGVFGNRGAWPAFWLLPFPDEWPPEIDILEWPQEASAQARMYWANTHAKKDLGNGAYSDEQLPKDVKFDYTPTVITGTVEDWHTYGCKITASTIFYYCDGVLVYQVANRTPGKQWYVILNMAFGGWWPGDPVDGKTVLPVDMRLGWLKHYKPA